MTRGHVAADGGQPRGGRWRRITVALVGGLAGASFMFFLIAVVQTPGLDPPPETAALFVVATTAGVIGYRLLRDGDPLGYPAAMLAGAIVLAVLALVMVGTYGPAGPRTNPVGPVSYAALAVAVIAAAGIGWRRDAAAEASSTSSSPS